jgi:CheY-like chemotaxis protein
MSLVMNRSQFIISLREALLNLYNPYELKHNPLQSIPTDQKVDSGSDLKLVLINSINALMPDMHTPYETKAWKFYELLNYCFIDQIGQKEAAKILHISLRTLQRLLPEAIETLAEQIASKYHLTLTEDEAEPAQKKDKQLDLTELDETWAKETAFLKSKYSGNFIDIRKMLKEISQILQPISDVDQNKVQIEFPEEAWLVMGQVTFLRQAVLTAISSFGRQKPGQIVISSERRGSQGMIQIMGRSWEAEFPNLDQSTGADIPAALTNLMQILKGSVEIRHTSSDELSILLSFPAQRQYKIMVVDDNADAIRLVQKYLLSSIYTVTGVQDPERVITELEKEIPFLILMDVMLPNIDGWMLLSQIRHNPGLSKIPVIVSTILPQEDLSISLGADGFLRKPYTPQELLQILDTHILKNPM